MISLITFLISTTRCQNKEENVISIIYNRQSNYSYSSKTSIGELSSIPPKYIVVPYQELVVRTSITCQSFQLDNPRKDLTKFHPQYSKYLRGPFDFVIPYLNITFDDIENFYAKILVNKKRDTSSIQTSFAEDITFENIPYILKDGMWHPIGVSSAQRTAILVPLQGREYNAKTFLLNMHAFLRRQQLTYLIILIEQVKNLI